MYNFCSCFICWCSKLPITYVVKSPIRRRATIIASDIQSSHCSNIFGTVRELIDTINQKYQNSHVKQIKPIVIYKTSIRLVQVIFCHDKSFFRMFMTLNFILNHSIITTVGSFFTQMLQILSLVVFFKKSDRCILKISVIAVSHSYVKLVYKHEVCKERQAGRQRELHVSLVKILTPL